MLTAASHFCITEHRSFHDDGLALSSSFAHHKGTLESLHALGIATHESAVESINIECMAGVVLNLADSQRLVIHDTDVVNEHHVA